MGSGWRGVFRRHEHTIAVGWLALVALLAGAVVLRPTRVAVLGAVERGARWWDDRWARRVDGGAALLASGAAEEAVAYLARLDRIHPATNVRHARDKERARVLRLLGRAYEATGRRGRAMETYQRLVAFDSLSYHNHYVLGLAAERLESGWAVAPEARDAFAAALRIHPSHLPSVRGYVAYYMDRGEFIPIRAAIETYLDAHLVQFVSVRIGAGVRPLSVLVDGRAREYELALPGAEPVAEVSIDAHGFPFEVERVELSPAATVGAPGALPPIELAIAARPAGPDGLTAPVAARTPAAQRTAVIRIRLAAFKPIDAGLWASVVKSYRNLLAESALPALARRVTVFPTTDAADQVIGRQPWATEGLGLGPDESLD